MAVCSMSKPMKNDVVPWFSAREGSCVPRRIFYEQLLRANDKYQCLDNWEWMVQRQHLSSDYPGKDLRRARRPQMMWPVESWMPGSSWNVQGYTAYEDGRPYMSKSLTLARRDSSSGQLLGIERHSSMNRIRLNNANTDITYQVCAHAGGFERAPIVLGLEFAMGFASDPDP